MRAMMSALDFRPFRRRLWASDCRPTGQPTAPATPKNRGSLRHPIQWIRTLPLTAPDNQLKTGKPNTTTRALSPVLRPKGVIARQTPKNAVTARICTLYRDFSARSDSGFTTSAPMHRTPIKNGRKRGGFRSPQPYPKESTSTPCPPSNPQDHRSIHVVPYKQSVSQLMFVCVV